MSKQMKELRSLNDTELNANLADLKEELFNLRFQSVTGQLENPMRIREVKKTYARIQTILTERKMGINQA